MQSTGNRGVSTDGQDYVRLKPTVLVVDDIKATRQDIRLLLDSQYRIITAACFAEGLDMVVSESPAVVLLDIDLQEELNGFDLLRSIRELDFPPEVIMLTSDSDVESVIQAIHQGAYHYLVKPPDRSAMITIIDRALNESKLKRKVFALENDLLEARDEFITVDKMMKPLMTRIEKTALTNAPTIITGETGTGKELIARRIHQQGERKDDPFIAVNIGAIPRDLAESQLFGHEKGAFTSATKKHLGYFEQASGGTIFIDEIGECPPDLQIKLLRVLQEKCITRITGTREIRVDVRVIVATNRDIDQMVADGRMRNDLWYRLNGIRIHIPPLRERPADIIAIADYYRVKIASQQKKVIVGISPEAKEFLAGKEWTGNARSLHNEIERAITFCDNKIISLYHLIENTNLTGGKIGTYATAKMEIRQRFLREYLHKLLKSCDGNVSKAAKTADMPRTALHRLMNETGIEAKDYKKPPGE